MQTTSIFKSIPKMPDENLTKGSLVIPEGAEITKANNLIGISM